MSVSGSARFYLGLKNSLLRFHYFNEREVRLLQDRQFGSIVQFANKKIPFYKNKFLEHKIDVRKIQNINQIKNLPFTEPNVFFAQSKDMRADKKSIYKQFRSSGTTGRPKDVYLSSFDWEHLGRLAYLRMFFSSGCSPFYKTLFLRSPQLSSDIRSRWFWKLGLMREKPISIIKSKADQAAVFNQYQPDVLYCLTSDGLALVDFIKGQNGHRHKAKYVFTTGEMLNNKDKQEMLDILGFKVIDFYANTEAGIIAWQCQKNGGYHINADQLYVEIVDGNRICREGEQGEVVLTTLTSRCSPLIRYRTGDIAVLEHGRCSCGSSFPRLSKIIGRRNDFLTDSDGERISPYVLMSAMDRFAEVSRYRIHQKKKTDYTIYLTLNESENNASSVREKIKKEYSNILGEKSNIMFADLRDLVLLNMKSKRKIIASDI